MEVGYIKVGGRLVSTASEEYKELMKWERKPNYNPDAPENQFPRMLYMGQRRPDGVISVNEVQDSIFGGQPGSAEAFSKQCQRIVYNERELAVALEEGWRKTQGEAIARFQAKDEYVSTAAAHRAYEDRNLSDKAKAEVAKAEAKTIVHVAEIPEARRRRRGRPSKTAAA